MKLFLSIILLIGITSCSKPDFQDVEGNGVSLQDLNEKWLIVNYWATWCAPCRAEIPELNELSLTQKDKLNVIGVNFDQPSMDELPQQVKKMKITFPVFRNDPSIKLGIDIPEMLPTTYVFAPGGKLVKVLVGPQTKEGLLVIINSPPS